MAEIDSNLIIGLVTILAPIIVGLFAHKTKQTQTILNKTKDGLDVAKKYLFVANVVTNQVSETIDTISKSLEGKEIAPAEAAVIGKQLSTIINTLKGIANDQELKDNKLV